MESSDIVKISALIIALAAAIIGHEIMHGLTAYKYGDETAKLQNRLSINPIVHIDPIGTIIVPAILYFSGAPFLFGWAKPVPINVHTVIRNGGYNGAIAVSLAGIAFNFFLAVSASLILGFLNAPESFIMLFIYYLLYFTIVYNVILGVFNLFPIPPLDGSHALSYLLRKTGLSNFADMMDRFAKYGMVVLIIIIATPLSSIIFFPAYAMIQLLLP